MMDTSVFANKAEKPDDFMLKGTLGDLFGVWMNIREYALAAYPKAMEEWNFPGQKYGWSFRIKDKKRAIIYMLPRDGFFLVALVFGMKATSAAVASEINKDIKTTIESAKVYAEGRGFRIEVQTKSIVEDIKKLIDIKLKN